MPLIKAGHTQCQPFKYIVTMKTKVLSLFLFIVITCGTVFGQELPDDVVQAFKKGDASLSEKYLNNSVQYIRASDQQTLSKEETVKALNRFFAENTPTDFTVVHRGKRENSGFVVGKLVTRKGTYRVHLLFKENNSQCQISQIRIDEFSE